MSNPTPALRWLLAGGLFFGGLAVSGIAETVAPPVPAVIVPRFTHPGASQTVYFVLTDRFANGSKANDSGGYVGGPDQSGFDPTRISHYHGGDFVGLTQHLDYLKNLGVTAVWVTPPFKNKPVQAGTAGYHGYWITDFLQIDPHLGTNDEYRTFIHEAHARGLKVYMDIIVNHTADVIQLQGDFTYRSIKSAPYRDAAGTVFDARAVAYNGLGDPAVFPALAADRSFAYQPWIPAGEEQVKNPDWLNDVTLYHNRGNSTFAGESATHGDFVGLDDVFTENPRVVRGFIEIFEHWQDEYGIDGFRIDTVRHVNSAFWQAFAPAIRAHARALGRPDFVQFGEVANEREGAPVLSEFSTNTIPLDTTLDFGFFVAARNFVSKAGSAAALAEFFNTDDYYTDHDSNVHTSTTFLGNHDAGRFAYFLQQDNPGASPAELAALVELGHGLLYLSRGQPVLYYGDEQGMIGRGGNDMQARESLFAAQAPDFRDASLLGTTRTGADDKYDPTHPFYRLFARLGALRAHHAALRTGAQIPRATDVAGLAAFSRIERTEQVEYLAVFNNSRTTPLTSRVTTSQAAGARLAPLFSSAAPAVDGTEAAPPVLTAAADGSVQVTLAPLQFALWRAETPLPAGRDALAVRLVSPATGAILPFTEREVDGLHFPSRPELRAEVTGADGFAEVTFALTRASRPGQYELIGTDDTAPYRVFWSRPADLAADDELTFIATVSDMRGRTATSAVAGVRVAASTLRFGIPHATGPVFVTQPPAAVVLAAGVPLVLTAEATGSGDLEYAWLRDGERVPGATEPALRVTTPGAYRVLVTNLAGTAISAGTTVTRAPTPEPTLTESGRIETQAAVPSAFVTPRRVDVWLPPGYDAAPARRWPVVYLQDGQNLFDPALSYGGHAWEIDRAMTALMASGRCTGAILVGIWNTGLTRFAEYMPQQAVSGDVVAHYAGGSTEPAGGLKSDAYLKFLVQELKPMIDRDYRTLPDRVHTVVMGSSMGGLISAYAVVQYPTVFGGAGCLSTHWPAGDGAVVDFVAAHLPAPGAHRWYFDHGTETLDATYAPYQCRMDAALSAAGYVAGRDWLTYEFAGAEHSERSWRERVDLPLAFLLGAG